MDAGKKGRQRVVWKEVSEPLIQGYNPEDFLTINLSNPVVLVRKLECGRDSQQNVEGLRLSFLRDRVKLSDNSLERNTFSPEGGIFSLERNCKYLQGVLKLCAAAALH